MLSVSPDPFFRFAGNLDLKRMVNVYMRRKKLVKFYLRRRRGFNDGNQRPSTALFSTEISAEKEQVLNTGPFYIVNDFLNTGFVGETPATCTLEKNLDNSEVKFESHASVMSSKPGDDIVLNTPRNLPENVPNNAQIPSGSKKINNENLVSVLQQLTSTYSLQRRPRSARKAASSASRRWVTIECAASDTSKSIASPGALSSTSVYCGIIPKTPIKEDKKSKFIAKRICLDVPSLLSTGLLEGAFVKYKKDNLELQGSLTTSGIRCGCSLCNFKKVVTSLNFEKHAGSKSYNQNDHIFFENGKSLYGLSKELKNVSLGSLGEVIEEKIGYRANADYNAWKVNPEMDNTKGVGKNQNHFSDLFHVVQESLNFPKGPRSARGKKPSPSVISKANQKPSRQLPFYDHDPLHPPAHKKMGLDMIPSKESVTLMVSSALTSSNSYQAMVGDSLLQNPENIRFPASIGENEVNMSDIYTPDTPLSSVSHLLATGLLEGLSVNYKKDEIELCGLIKDLGILCGCSSCHFRKVLSLLSFEKHGGSSSKDRNKYIFVNDKITLRALVEELWGVPLGLLSHEVIEKMIGCKPNMNCFMAWKGSFDKLESSPQQTSTVDGKNKLTDVLMHHKRSSDERSRLPTSEDNLSLPSRNVPEIDFPGQAGQTMGHRFPKGPRSARGKKPSPSVISKANQNPSRQLPFYDHDPLHPPAHKKMGLDMIPSKESVTLMVSSALTSSNSYQAKVGDSLLQNPENIRSPAPIGENEVNMSDIYTPDTPLSSVNHLLATGLLEGLSVNYKKDEIELCGLIKDLGILCGCSSCHFRKVLSLLSFEKHGGSSSKDRNKYIFVNDKITLRALVEELWGVPLGLLSHEVIEKMVGCKPNMNCFMAWKGSFDKLESSRQQTSTVDGKNKLTDVWMHHKRSSDERSRLPTSEDNLSLPSRNVPEIDFPGQAGQTMRHRDQDFHQYIFDLLNDGSKLSYRSHGEEVLTGYKIGKNILCNCCNVPVTPSKFEAHAGHGTRRKPYHSIYTSYGKSLHQIAMFLLHENSVEHSNKDHIMISKAGRDLPLHAYNAGEPCPSVCGSFSFYMGRKFLVPCTSGSCMICRDGDATLNFGNICDSTMLFCGQCSRKFHVGCLRHHGICDIERRPCPPDIWLCGNNCRKVRADLLDFIQSGPKTVPESLLSSLKSCSAESTSREETEVDVHWQLLSGTFQGDESKSLLEQATEIFQGAFYAVYKGHRDVLSTMVKGERGVAEFFGGMLCAVITVKSIIVSAALLRVFGNHVAELPLAVTSKERQEEGYFKILFLKIEEMLSFMKVENLILPADDDSLSMWVEKFGFTKLNKNEIMEYRMKHSIVMFEKTIMLKKAIASTIL